MTEFQIRDGTVEIFFDILEHRNKTETLGCGDVFPFGQETGKEIFAQSFACDSVANALFFSRFLTLSTTMRKIFSSVERVSA